MNSEAIVRDDETLLWQGQPRTDFLFVPYDAILVPFGLISSTLATMSAVASIEDAVDLIFTGLFAAFAVVVFARFAFDLYVRKNTTYVVTDKRIAIKYDTFLDRTVRSVDFTSSFRMTPIRGPKNSVTIYFGPMNVFWDFYWPPNYPLSDMCQPPAFAFLDNAVAVMGAINGAIKKRQLDGESTRAGNS